MWELMKYGPLGQAVERARPVTEADPIGVYAAALAQFSAAVNGRVMQANGRPAVVWTVLVGKSAVGRKGYALRTATKLTRPSLGRFLGARTFQDITSGPSLVNLLYTLELESATTEAGVDGRAFVVEEEWAGVLKRAKRCPTFSQKLRTAWDGGSISNTTKEEPQEVRRPLLGFHGHITPGEWHKWISGSDALGGSYNRMLPVQVERSQILSYRHRMEIEPSPELAEAYRWACDEPRYIDWDDEAGRQYDELRAILDDRLALMPESISCYMERAAEQVWRVAAILAATEMTTVITRPMLDAAWALVEFSMTSVERLVSQGAQASQPAQTLPDVIRGVLQRYGGEATSSMMLRALGTRVNAEGLRAAVSEMDDVRMFKDSSATGRGAKPIMYALIEPAEAEPGREPEKSEPAMPRDALRPALTVVRAVQPTQPLREDAQREENPVVVSQNPEAEKVPAPKKAKKAKKAKKKPKEATQAAAVVPISPPEPPAPPAPPANPFLAAI